MLVVTRSRSTTLNGAFEVGFHVRGAIAFELVEGALDAVLRIARRAP